MAMKKISVTDIAGFKLGNAENSEKGTGCTVIVCEEGAVGGVDVRGGGPATRETDLLRSENTVNSVNAVVLSGGSAFGLESASGVMRELADLKIGFDVGDDIVVPIVCGAALYDLPVGDKAFPDVYMGAQAVRNAFAGSFANGNHGAGTGATVGKLKGYDRAMKSGLGTFACGDGVIEVGAVAAVNAVGDIYNGAGNIIAGLRSEDGESIYGTIKTLKNMVHDVVIQPEEPVPLITKSDIEEALAAAAKQYKEEKALEMQQADEVMPEAETESIPEAEPESTPEATEAKPVTEFVFETPSDETAFENEAENAEGPEEITEEPAAAIEEPAASTEETEEVFEEPYEEAQEAETIAKEPAEIFEEPAEEPEEIIEEFAEVFDGPDEVPEESEEEFVPDTPSVDFSETADREYAEISIPVVTEKTEEYFEEPVEEAEEIIEESAEEPEEITEEFAEVFDEPAQEAEVIAEEPAEIYEEPAEEPEEIMEEFAEVFDEPAQEAEPIAEEPAEEVQEAEEEPVTPVFEEPETVIQEPELIYEAEEVFEEEEPAVLTREDMGYDIVFNTTISCLITNAELTKSQANKLASILHDAYARAIKPVHGTMDGDTVFVLATGKQKVNFDAFAALATDVMQYAIIDGALSAESAYGLPAARDMQK